MNKKAKFSQCPPQFSDLRIISNLQKSWDPWIPGFKTLSRNVQLYFQLFKSWFMTWGRLARCIVYSKEGKKYLLILVSCRLSGTDLIIFQLWWHWGKNVPHTVKIQKLELFTIKFYSKGTTAYCTVVCSSS